MARTCTQTRTHDFVTEMPHVVPVPMVSNLYPYQYPYPWPRTSTRTNTHDPHYKSVS